jgi:hypothetical protein
VTLRCEWEGVMKINIILCSLLGNSSASEFYMLTFQNTLFNLHRRVGSYIPANEDGTHRVFRNVGIQNSDAG